MGRARKLTDTQMRWLWTASHSPNGLAVFTQVGSGGVRGRAQWHRMMLGLVDRGLFTPNAWGEYTITAAGRDVVSEKDAQ